MTEQGELRVGKKPTSWRSCICRQMVTASQKGLWDIMFSGVPAGVETDFEADQNPQW